MRDEVVVGALAVLEKLVAGVLPCRKQRHRSPQRGRRIRGPAVLGAETAVLVLALLDKSGGRGGVVPGVRRRRDRQRENSGESRACREHREAPRCKRAAGSEEGLGSGSVHAAAVDSSKLSKTY